MTNRDQRGLTIIEVVVVGVLATIVMLAITGFYINSQGAWIDASSQAVTQREASAILEEISEQAHDAYCADITTPRLIFLGPGYVETCRFWVDSDSLMHWGDPGVPDRGAMGTSKVMRFALGGSNDSSMVKILALELRSASGKIVGVSSNMAFFNRPALP